MGSFFYPGGILLPPPPLCCFDVTTIFHYTGYTIYPILKIIFLFTIISDCSHFEVWKARIGPKIKKLVAQRSFDGKTDNLLLF